MILNEDKEYILNTYNRLPLEIKKAKGSYIYDIHNTKYLDMYSGIAVNQLGHRHKVIVKSIKKQLHKYLHVSNYFATKQGVNLAKLLINKTHFKKVFYANSGTEANEAAIKLVRKYALEKSLDKIEMIALKDGFHGRTIGGLSLTGRPQYKTMFGPLLQNIFHIDINDIEKLEEIVNQNTAAVFLEMIQGESGVKEVSQEFINKLKELKKKYDFLIVVDEVQTGLYRTGKLFSYEHYNLKPDLVTLAKGIGGGLPLGVLLVSKELEDVIKRGEHGTTFGGNPVALASGYAQLNYLSQENIQIGIYKNSSYLYKQLIKLKDAYPNIIKEVRGKGFMLGLEVGSFSDKIKQRAYEEKLLLNITNTSVIRLLPSLEMSIKELDLFLKIFEKILIEMK